MAAVLIDSNVMLDLMTEDSRWFSWSAAALTRVIANFRVVINPIIYAEVSIRYRVLRPRFRGCARWGRGDWQKSTPKKGAHRTSHVARC
jgi:predicted nucleic acid-binding protein